MNTKTTNKWLKLLVVAAMLTVNASGAWAACEAEYIKSECVLWGKCTKQTFAPTKEEASYFTEIYIRQTKDWYSSKEDRGRLLAKFEKIIENGINNMDPSLLSPGVSKAAVLVDAHLRSCYLRTLGVTEPDKTIPNANEEPKPTGQCKVALDKLKLDLDAVNRTPAPQGATPPMMRVMWATREAINVMTKDCPQTPANQKEIAEYRRVYEQAEKSCNVLINSSVKCEPNPYR